MNELQRVRELHADEPPPSEAARRAARRALDQAMERENPRPRPVRRAYRRRLGALGLATAAASGAVLVGVLGSGGSEGGPPLAAAAVFRQLAQVIARQSLMPHHGQYLYTDSTAAYQANYDNTCMALIPQRRQIWIGPNGSGLVRESYGQGTATLGGQRASCRSMARNHVAFHGGSTWFAPRCLAMVVPTSKWRGLSTNPHVLLEQMQRIDGGPRTPAEDFVHIGDFLRETMAPPSVRATIYKAAALIPGIKSLGWVRDHYGRRGLGVSYTSNGNTSELIFDRQTGELLGEKVTSRTGELENWAVYLRQRIVNQLPSRPPLPLNPPCNPPYYSGHTTHTSRGDVTTGGHGPKTTNP